MLEVYGPDTGDERLVAGELAVFATFIVDDVGNGRAVNTVPGSSPSAADAAYEIVAAPAGAWRHFGPHHPDPGYYEFDWLSSQHPDLYHAFALSTEGLTAELEQLVDLRGLTVIDMGAGTGRSAIGLSRSPGGKIGVCMIGWGSAMG